MRSVAPTRLLRSVGRLQLSVRFPCRLLGRGAFRKGKTTQMRRKKKTHRKTAWKKHGWRFGYHGEGSSRSEDISSPLSLKTKIKFKAFTATMGVGLGCVAEMHHATFYSMNVRCVHRLGFIGHQRPCVDCFGDFASLGCRATGTPCGSGFSRGTPPDASWNWSVL